MSRYESIYWVSQFACVLLGFLSHAVTTVLGHAWGGLAAIGLYFVTSAAGVGVRVMIFSAGKCFNGFTIGFGHSIRLTLPSELFSV
jgi:hypothetical protein